MVSGKISRGTIPQAIQDDLLEKSRRRCCMCWCLEGKGTLAFGQIAHIDRDPSNGDPDNLVWLCLRHHDEYDAKRRQSKGFTPGELKRYRDRLYAEVTTGGGPTPVLEPDVMIKAGRDINAGGDIIVGSVTNIITKTARGKRQPQQIIPGTVAENHRMHNYLNYLIERYNKFKESDFKRPGQKMKWPLIRVAYQREMKCPVRHTPISQFEEAVAYLQGRIKNTRVGRIEGSRGNKLFQSFEEYPN